MKIALISCRRPDACARKAPEEILISSGFGYEIQAGRTPMIADFAILVERQLAYDIG
jgi:hypothetical protein